MRVAAIAVLALALAGCGGDKEPAPAERPAKPPETAKQRAQRLARSVIIADGHVDLPYRLTESRGPDGALTEDVSTRTEKGNFDYPRARAGGLDAPFMSIYIPAKHQATPGASKKLADELIDLVESLAAKHPDKFALARSPADVEASFAAGKIALPMGIENGSALEDDLANVKHFHDRGVRYITLSHGKDNLICDSSYDDKKTHKGLSAFGREVVAEMNRLGIMVDISHVSDDAFWQVMELTKAPVIASHSSLRHFTPGFERNMTDDMVKKVAEGGGVVLINFGSSFVTAASRAYFEARWKAAGAYQKEHGYADDSPEMKAWGDAYDVEHPRVYATVSDVADHIDRVVQLAGVDHVGFGSDFDGVGDTLPRGLEDVSMYPALIEELLRRGYSEQDIAKIAGGNFLRVWRAVEAHAAGQ